MKKILKIILLISISIAVIVIGSWIYLGPEKNISYKVGWKLDESARRWVPLFWVRYTWDRSEDEYPTWIVYPNDGKWWVCDLTHGGEEKSDPTVDPEIIFWKYVHKNREEFTGSWIDQNKFYPKFSRYELVMTAIGLDQLFKKEKRAFFDIKKKSKDFDEGLIQPDE